MTQAEAAAKEDEMAVVINRRSYQSTGQSFALVRLDSLLVLYNSWLREQGIELRPQCPSGAGASETDAVNLRELWEES